MKNRRYEKIKSGLPKEEKPKSGLEKSRKPKCPFAKYLTVAFAILMAGTMGGCTLAVPDAGEEGSGDRTIGTFITTEYLDLYDMESYLNDHASSLVNDGSITLGNDSKYEGKLFADVEKGEADSPLSGKFPSAIWTGNTCSCPCLQMRTGNSIWEIFAQTQSMNHIFIVTFRTIARNRS